MSSHEICSWGRVHRYEHEVLPVYWRSDVSSLLSKSEKTVLPYGLGRSYGDACLNDGGGLLETSNLNRFLHFNQETGLLRCEAGVSLDAIIREFLPKGWFLPVCPGTKYVTVGGAIANDIHGKNHHVAGTFGNHVKGLELIRSQEGALECSLEKNGELFCATIGGLGLTGLISWVDLQLLKVPSGHLEVESIRYDNLEEYCELERESTANFDYTVSWVDALAKRPHLGRGHFLRGNFVEGKKDNVNSKSRLSIPFDAPGWLLNSTSIQAFNTLYYQRQRTKIVKKSADLDSFFFPLDSIHHWNRIYGKKGFYQYQFVIPSEKFAIVQEVFSKIAQSKLGSFLAVLKVFGDLPSVGLMSFPMPGITLALDFANKGTKTLQLFRELDNMVADAGGRVYLAKDGRMDPASFRKFYPNWEKFSSFIDPKFSSSLWRRVVP